MKHFLLILGLVGLTRPAMAEVNHWKSETSRTWPFLRGNVEFVVIHPLRIFHARMEKMAGFANLDPEDANKGMQIQVQGNTRNFTFEDPKAAPIIKWIGGGTEWSLESHSFILRGGGDDGRRIEPTLNFKLGSHFLTDKLPMTCQNDLQVLKCRFDTRVPAPRLGVPLPTLFGIPSQPMVAMKGEVVFGEKEGPQ